MHNSPWPPARGLAAGAPLRSADPRNAANPRPRQGRRVRPCMAASQLAAALRVAPLCSADACCCIQLLQVSPFGHTLTRRHCARVADADSCCSTAVMPQRVGSSAHGSAARAFIVGAAALPINPQPPQSLLHLMAAAVRQALQVGTFSQRDRHACSPSIMSGKVLPKDLRWTCLESARCPACSSSRTTCC